ncbi:MAG: hypothetical protein LIO76_06415 [Clostridiales bacterium]|nr:hypothetical protein [Clostridiales bacterium]
MKEKKETEEEKESKMITIPNIMSLFRIILISFIVYILLSLSIAILAGIMMTRVFKPFKRNPCGIKRERRLSGQAA